MCFRLRHHVGKVASKSQREIDDMCGIGGVVFRDGVTESSTAAILDLAHNMLRRGPDDVGICLVGPTRNTCSLWRTEFSAVGSVDYGPKLMRSASVPHSTAMCHTRFSIIDLTARGRQPLSSSGGLVCLAFNGEVYNYIELRDEIARSGYSFKTNTDTVVFLAAYLRWGVGCFERLNGFWASAIYDCRE